MDNEYDKARHPAPKQTDGNLSQDDVLDRRFNLLHTRLNVLNVEYKSILGLINSLNNGLFALGAQVNQMEDKAEVEGKSVLDRIDRIEETFLHVGNRMGLMERNWMDMLKGMDDFADRLSSAESVLDNVCHDVDDLTTPKGLLPDTRPSNEHQIHTAALPLDSRWRGIFR